MSNAHYVPQAVFYAKTWYLYVAAIVVTLLAVFNAIFGPLFLFDIIKRADGKPGTEAGIAMSIIAVLLIPVALLIWFNIYANRRPLLRICEEGLEINVIGASSINDVPMVPAMFRAAWLIISLQGFKKQIVWVPWNLLRKVHVRGSFMVHFLVVDATIIYPTFHGNNVTAQIGDNIVFRDAAFQDPLQAIASAILWFRDNLDARDVLPNLHE